jgi:hypothetical protein
MTEEPEVQKEEKPKQQDARVPTQEEIDRAINKLFGVSGAICMN